jgi:hypothetical protein
MELFKIKIARGKRGLKKKFYESRKSFEKYWISHQRYSKYYEVIAYQIDWENKCWKEIRRVSPTKKGE